MSRSATATSVAIVVALALCGVASAQRPNQAEDDSAALVDEGRAALVHGELDGAAKALDQAIALNPRRVDAYVLRAAVFAAKKQYKSGIALMRKARALAPDDSSVLVALGSQLVLSGDAQTGVPLLQQVVAKEPARYDAQLLLGHHWHDVGKWPDAIAALEAYFAHRPAELAREDARHRIDLADAYLRYHQPQQALALFEAAARDRKSDLRAHIGVAWATAAVDRTFWGGQWMDDGSILATGDDGVVGAAWQFRPDGSARKLEWHGVSPASGLSIAHTGAVAFAGVTSTRPWSLAL